MHFFWHTHCNRGLPFFVRGHYSLALSGRADVEVEAVIDPGPVGRSYGGSSHPPTVPTVPTSVGEEESSSEIAWAGVGAVL